MKLQVKTIFGSPIWEKESWPVDMLPIPQVGHEIINAKGTYYIVQSVRHTPHKELVEVFVLQTKAAPK
jgi:hypothetical protein